jgi:hypothetical protein
MRAIVSPASLVAAMLARQIWMVWVWLMMADNLIVRMLVFDQSLVKTPEISGVFTG